MPMDKIIAGVLPSGVPAKCGAICAALGVIVEEMYGYNAALPALLMAMALDYLTGMLAAVIYKQRHPKSKKGLDSRVGAVGILKKVMILSIVVFSHLIAGAISIPEIESLVTWFYLGNEGLSIVENAAKSGAPVPEKLLNLLEQLTEDEDEKNDREKSPSRKEK